MLLCKSLYATEQVADILYYKNQKIHIYSYPLESRVKNDSTLNAKLDKLGCFSTACWRRVIGIYEIKNDSLFLIGLKEPCKRKPLRLDHYFGNSEISNGRVFVDWFSGHIDEGYGKYMGFSASNLNNIYENKIEVDINEGKISNLRVTNQVKSKILGAWGNNQLGNAIIAFYSDSIYFSDSNLTYKYTISSDTIIVFLNDTIIERIQILEISDDWLKLNYLKLGITEKVSKRN